MIFEEKYLSSYIHLNFIAWLPLLRKILSNICIVIACEPDCDAINFEITLINQTVQYLQNKQRFQGKIKSIFHHFLRAFTCQKLSQTWKCVFE